MDQFISVADSGLGFSDHPFLDVIICIFEIDCYGFHFLILIDTSHKVDKAIDMKRPKYPQT